MENLSDREIDALFAGRSNAGGDELNELVRAVKSVSQEPPAPAIQRRHLAAIVAKAQISASQTGLAPVSRRQKMRSIFRPVWVKAIAVLGVALAATTGLASAGVMPSPAQDALSEVAEKLGFEVPASDNAGQKADDAKDEGEDGEDDGTGIAGEDVEGTGAENGKSVADDVHDVLADETLEGREKGEAVSDAASQNRQNETHSHSRPSPSPAGGPPAGLPGGNPNG